MAREAQLYPLHNVIQEYAWGSLTELPRLMGLPESGAPQAELWMGTHPKAPSQACVDGQWTDLRALLTNRTEELLGVGVASKFGGELPFLLKVLAVAEPLSLQAHPNPDQARAGFERENKLGIPVDAPYRNYRDAFAKPELLCALSAFRALCGFRPWAETKELFEMLGLAADIPGFPTPALTEPRAIEQLFRSLLGLEQQACNALLASAERACRHGAPPDYLASCATLLELATKYPGDAGALTSLMLNAVELKPGEAIYLPAGNLHAYLGGLGVEIMAASDNVLRGGLTTKHVDQAELLQTLQFQGAHVTPLPAPAARARHWRYPTAAAEFELMQIILRADSWICEPQAGPRILFVADGPVQLGGATITELKRGESVFVPASSSGFVASGIGALFVASVPQGSSPTQTAP